MTGIGIGELVIIALICAVLGGGVAGVAGLIFFVTRKKSD